MGMAVGAVFPQYNSVAVLPQDLTSALRAADHLGDMCDGKLYVGRSCEVQTRYVEFYTHCWRRLEVVRLDCGVHFSVGVK